MPEMLIIVNEPTAHLLKLLAKEDDTHPGEIVDKIVQKLHQVFEEETAE